MKQGKSALILVLVVMELLCLHRAGQAQSSPDNQVYQYSVMAAGRRAYLWIPPQCRHIKGIIISLSNLLERNWLEDPVIRKMAKEEGLGIIWVGNAKGSPLTADMKDGAGGLLQQLFTDFAVESGYPEITYAPLIPMGHSANGQFSWTTANWNPARIIAAIPVKTVPLPDTLAFSGVPLCYVVGQTTECPQYRVPDPATHPGDRDFYWPVARQSALALRSAPEDNLVGVVTESGGGHFDWSERQARFIALYIRKAFYYRLPETAQANGSVQLKKIDAVSGWLMDTGGMEPDSHPPAPYKQYTGDPRKLIGFLTGKRRWPPLPLKATERKEKGNYLLLSRTGNCSRWLNWVSRH
jgi:hypothetical protein